MPKLKAMLKQQGVLAVGKFSSKGLLEDVQGDLTEADASLAARMCAANAISNSMQARLLAVLSGQEELTDHVGWTLIGRDLGMVVVEDVFCMIRLPEASVNDTVQALREQAGLG